MSKKKPISIQSKRKQKKAQPNTYIVRFSDPAREPAWDTFWDEMYALLLPFVIEQREQDRAA